MIGIYHQFHAYFLIFFAAFCGGALGTEREITGHRQAGRRTLALVSLGACIFSILPMLQSGITDPWRNAAQVISGIGFIGGGVLIKENFSVKGMTTAATIWISAAIGICFAADQILMGFFSTVFTFIILKFKKEPIDYFKNNQDNTNKINN
jgi:putative Mg2+ transporter-C (MgtC) family protein